MANLLWGKIYYQEFFAGILQEEPGDRFSFEYDKAYLKAGHPAIAHTLPTQVSLHKSEAGLPPFFDNLVSEGWLEQAQARLLGKRSVSRFELLLAFGYDCAGAVSVIDPEPVQLSQQLLNADDPKEMAVLTSRASLSGVQPKLAIIERHGQYYPTKIGELSTHIAKFPSNNHPDLIINEYLTLKAFKAFLPEDTVVELDMHPIQGLPEPALVIKRFDRSLQGRVHFEEFNQLLGRKSIAKYDGSHKEMSDFIHQTKKCCPIDNYCLYARILVGLLLGNTDMHFKNFAMFHTPTGLRLTPSYDQISAALYQYKTIALTLGGASNLPIGTVKAKHLVALAKEFKLPNAAVDMLYKQLAQRKEAAAETIASAEVKTPLKDQLIKLMEARWNGTYALIGQILSTKP
jgi:serine/threonine-protein kinase HipA